ncbi:MAG TPA: protein kinase [Coxiellaceae bacterium]|nr:MAG: hypothetical protein A3E81_02915 [Gammaproteobacteria bacterium RIFCSPHIGHO2_12_FULL_36_30]HLB56267.1 protein kinase [Coxiellaceae bacterium]
MFRQQSGYSTPRRVNSHTPQGTPQKSTDFRTPDRSTALSTPNKSPAFLSRQSTACKISDSFLRDEDNWDIDFGDEIGRGGFGVVYNATLISRLDGTSYQCVVKELMRYSGEKIPDEFEMHDFITNNIRSSIASGVLRSVGVKKIFDEESQRWRFFSIMPKCDVIFSKCLPSIKELRDTHPDVFCKIVTIFLNSMMQAFATLSDKKITHRDIKPDNIAFYKLSGFCLLDFGSAALYEENVDINGTTPLFMAPEIADFNREERETKPEPFFADVWSLGQILRELLGMEFLFPANDCDNRTAHIYHKGSVYTQERNKTSGLFDADTHQQSLQKNICKFSDCCECLIFLASAMTDIFPERRPNLKTLQVAVKKLRHFTKDVVQADVDSFYGKMLEVTTAKITNMKINTPPRNSGAYQAQGEYANTIGSSANSSGNKIVTVSDKENAFFGCCPQQSGNEARTLYTTPLPSPR